MYHVPSYKMQKSSWGQHHTPHQHQLIGALGVDLGAQWKLAALDVPADEAAFLHASPDPSAVTHAIAHRGWMMLRGVVTSAAALPGSMSDMRDSSRQIRRDMKKSSLVRSTSAPAGTATRGMAPPPQAASQLSFGIITRINNCGRKSRAAGKQRSKKSRKGRDA